MQLRSVHLAPAAAIVPFAMAWFLPPVAAAAQADPHPDPAPPADRAAAPPACGDPSAAAFPIRPRLDGGSAAYVADGRPRQFLLTLSNDAAVACEQIHPVVVLVDRDRKLTPDQIELAWRGPRDRAWRPVALEGTDHAENVGLPGGEDGPGVTVPAHGSVTLRMRMRLAPGATAPDRVVASATMMQRRGARGMWVGESNHFAFDVLPAPPELAATGPRAARPLAAACALLAMGAALVVGSRWRRR